MTTLVYKYCRFIMFSSFDTIFGMYPESIINFYLSYFLLDLFAIYNLTCLTSSVMFLFSFFILVTIILLKIFLVAIVTFIRVVFFVTIGT